MRKSARRLAKHKPKLETLREVVDEAVEAMVVVAKPMAYFEVDE
jgi:hypothetical protein